jgi:SAM-dependent methyltransferase
VHGASTEVSSLADSLVPSIPFLSLLVSSLGLGLVKLTAYSQLEVVRTAMLSRHVKNGGAKVLQLGGTTRDLYYYPPKTVKVTVNGLGIRRGLFEQAGMTVGVPVEATSMELLECLKATQSNSLDSVVAFEQFGALEKKTELESVVREVARVLKPGGTFIFYERLADGGLGQVLVGGGSRLAVGEIVSASEYWDFSQYDVAAAGLDAHDVGVAIKAMDGMDDDGTADGVGSSVDSSAFEAMLRKERTRKKRTGFGRK